MRIPALVVALTFSFVLRASAQSEASIADAMRTIGAAWNRIVQNGETFVAQCERGGFAAFRLAPETTIRIDLQKTNSVLNPYLGIVSIVGKFQENTPNLIEQATKPRCYRSVQEAQSVSRFWGNDMTYSFVLNYQVNGRRLVLVNADFRFMNNGGNDLSRRVNEATDADWNAALSAPLQ